MGKFYQIFTELSARNTIMAGYYSLTFLLDSSGVGCSFCGLVAVPCAAFLFFSCCFLFVTLLLCLVDSV